MNQPKEPTGTGTRGDASRLAGTLSSRDPRASIPIFSASSPDYAARIRESFARQGAMALIGAELVDVEPGYCAIALVPRPEVSQQHGYVHAGILAALVDSAGGYAGYTLFPQDSSVLTAEYKLNLLAPAQGERIVAEGFVVKPGRTLAVTRGEVHAERAGQRTLIAIMQQTLVVMHGKPDRPVER
jgi:uncharacterized protein (TIGR00369 family)